MERPDSWPIDEGVDSHAETRQGEVEQSQLENRHRLEEAV